MASEVHGSGLRISLVVGLGVWLLQLGLSSTSDWLLGVSSDTWPSRIATQAIVALLVAFYVKWRPPAKYLAAGHEPGDALRGIALLDPDVLQTIINTIPELVWLKDADGVYMACNPEFQRFFGQPEQRIVGRTDFDFVPAELAEFFRQKDREAIEAGRPTVNEEWVTFADDGHVALLLTTKTPMYGDDGALVGILGIAHDITSVRESQDALEQSRRELELAVEERTAELSAANQKMLDTQFAMDIAGIGISWADVETAQFTYANHYYAQALGYSFEEFLTLTVHDIDPDFTRQKFREMCRTIEVQGSLRFETLHRARDGREFPVEMTVYYSEGSVTARPKIIAFMTDITRRKDHENNLIVARQEALAASQANARLAGELEAANRILSMSDQRLGAMFDISQKAPFLAEGDLLQLGVDEAVRLTHSQIGYLHFVSEDQETIDLQRWSSDTLAQCAAAYDDHYPVSAAGVWADSIRSLRAVVHNDYQNLTPRRGYPPGHVHLMRHLGVPVLDGGKVHMLLGVGNKATDYDDSDRDQLQRIGNDMWSIIVRRRAETALADAKKAAEAATLAKSQFLANMSHEIRTPLNAITGMAHLIRRSGIPPQQGARLDKIERAGQHLLEIINAILDLSKIEAGKFLLEENDVTLGAVMENVASILLESAQAKGLSIRIDNQVAEQSYVGDATRLQQGLLNYGSNALKFAEHGTITISARVEVEESEYSVIRFDVRDQGIGIDPERIPSLFTAFEQADKTTTRKYGGTGLGLAITKKLAELMGGEAGARSEPEGGSDFWFTARLRKNPAPAAVAAVTPVPAATAESLLMRDCRSCRLLLVEDEPINREVTLELLHDIWPQVDTAVDGAVAVRMLETQTYNLILMDMQMPNMDGLEATRRLRRLPNGRTVPVIAMTANAFSEDKQRCFAAGMNDFLAKPVIPEALFEVILKWLRR